MGIKFPPSYRDFTTSTWLLSDRLCRFFCYTAAPPTAADSEPVSLSVRFGSGVDEPGGGKPPLLRSDPSFPSATRINTLPWSTMA